MLKKKAAAGM